jgi:hypothetical protein
VKLVRIAYEYAHEEHKRAVAERAAAHAGAKAWDEYNPDDGVGGMSQRPYNLNRVDEAEIAAQNTLADMREAYEHAVDTFLGDTE